MSGAMSGIIPESGGRNYVSPLKKAIKDYQDEMLTGLTEEERAEIDAKVAAYRKKCEEAGMDSKAVRSAVNDYYKSLLKEYGAKFDTDFGGALEGAEGEASASQVDNGTASDTKTGAVKSPEANTEKKTNMKTEVQTDPDGTVYLLVTSPNGINMKIKIGNDGDSEERLAEGIKKSQRNIGVLDYEKNNDAFFEESSGIMFES